MEEEEIKIPHLMAPINIELRNLIGKWEREDYFKLLAAVIEMRKILKEMNKDESDYIGSVVKNLISKWENDDLFKIIFLAIEVKHNLNEIKQRV